MSFDAYEDVSKRLNLGKIRKPALIGLVLIVIMVAVLAAGRLSGTATASDFQIASKSESGASLQASQTEQDDQATIFVHVSGAVEKPGLYEIKARSRVADAVQAAGGLTDDASPDSVNLARTLSDGEHIIIAHQADGEEGQGSSSATNGQPTSTSPLVNINTATSVELQSLPGIGASTAEKIIADREANGPFKTIDDLKRVSGIGDKKFETLENSICI